VSSLTAPGLANEERNGAAVERNERRRATRASVLIPIRLRPVRFCDGNFEDLTSTANVSRGCLSAMTWRDSYYEKMRVMVTYPYATSGRDAGSRDASSRDAGANGASGKGTGWEYLGEVVRVEAHPDGRYRVAIKLQFVMQASPNPRLISL
jgi:hypothetical protein